MKSIYAKPKVLGVPIDNSATAYHRVVQPLHYLREQGNPIQFLGEPLDQPQQYAWANILYIQCLYAPGAFQFYAQEKEKGKKIFVDFDDDYFNIPEDSPQQTEVIDSETGEAVKFSPELRTLYIKLFLGLADQVIVTTKTLKELYQPFTKNEILVIPNCISFDMRRDKPKVVSDKVNILFSGSASHLPDLEQLKEPLQLLHEKYGEKISIHMQGPLNYNEIFSVPIISNPAVEYSEYLNCIQDLNPDIALLPLKNNAFNLSKSELKFCQMTLLDAACVASDVGPYSFITNGVNGMKCNSTEDWVRSISELIENSPLRNSIISNAVDHVFQNFSLEKHLEVWKDLIS